MSTHQFVVVDEDIDAVTSQIFLTLQTRQTGKDALLLPLACFAAKVLEMLGQVSLDLVEISQYLWLISVGFT